MFCFPRRMPVESPVESFDPRSRGANVTDVVYHVIIYLAVMTVLAIIAFIAGSWSWFIAAASGWGIVVIGHGVYVFIWEAGGQDPLRGRDAIRRAAPES